MIGPQAHFLEDKKRLHLNHGPIDLVIEAFGSASECHLAYRQAWDRFQTVLAELVGELARLRQPVSRQGSRLEGRVARRMEAAALAHWPAFATPMIAVAGAVAEEVLNAMCTRRALSRAYVNNGGDIALMLSPHSKMAVAIAADGLDHSMVIRHEDPVRGVATSGWRGRSFSLGIADAVTVAAGTAAPADAAATLIANAVDLPGHPGILRRPALDLDPESDLGERLVTVEVGGLDQKDIEEALQAGWRRADSMASAGLIEGAVLFLGGQQKVAGRAIHTVASHALP